MDCKDLFGDKAYAYVRIKKMAREFGWYYGIQDKAYRNRALSRGQHRRNSKLGCIRSVVEYLVVWMKTQSKALKANVSSQVKNAVIFEFCCMCWNVKQAGLLPAKGP